MTEALPTRYTTAAAQTPRFQDWRVIGAQALVTGRVVEQGGQLRVDEGGRHQPGSGPWPSRNLRQSAGRFSWKEAMPSLGSGP